MTRRKLRERLSKEDKDLLRYIDTVGATSPIVLQIKFGRTKKSVQDSLKHLFLTGDIIRPVKGLVLSRSFYERKPEKRAEVEKYLDCVLPIDRSYRSPKKETFANVRS